MEQCDRNSDVLFTSGGKQSWYSQVDRGSVNDAGAILVHSDSERTEQWGDALNLQVCDVPTLTSQDWDSEYKQLKLV